MSDNYVPKSAVGKWFNERLPLLDLIYGHLMPYPTPKNLNYFWTFGGILTFCLVTQIITGLVLAMHYVADADLAFASVEHIMRDVNYGWLLRYIHANGASLFFMAVYIHMARSMFYGSYKEPRELIWIIGVFIFLLMIATAFMGYVLPWGQMSFWGATVITNLFSAIPIVGESVTNWLWGGYAVGSPLLTRFFTLHYLMPFLIFALVILHVWALHVPGNNNPEGIDVVKGSQDTVPFHPHYVVKDLFALVVFLIIFAGFVFFVPNLLGHTDNYIQSNPLQTPEHIVEAGVKALKDGHHGYTQSTGMPKLREAVSDDIRKRHNVQVSPNNVIIVPGGKVIIFFSAMLMGEKNKEILYPNPGFPIYESAINYLSLIHI